jgi:hypothetical protein
VKKIIVLPLLSVLALVLTACGASAGSSQSNTSSSGGSSSDTGSASGSSNPAPANGTPAGGPTALQLAAGMLKLDGTSNAVTAQQAAQLLPLWQSLQQIQSTPVAPSTPQAQGTGTPGGRFNSAMMQQMNAQIVLIQNAMTPAQIQAITAMNLSMQDIFTVFQQNGITMMGPGQGGGFTQNGGTFTPPQGTPRAYNGTPGAFGGGNFNGGRRGFGNFLPSTVVNGIVQYLQKKAGTS